MKKLSHKSKSGILIAGTALICIGAIALALNMSNSKVSAETTSASVPSVPSSSEVIFVPPIEPSSATENSKSGTSSAFVPSSGVNKTAELTKIDKPVSAPPPPSVASGTDLADKNKQPSYSSSSVPAKSSSTPPKKASSSTTKKANATPKMGDKRTSNGQKQVYVDGFGWIEDGGGGGQGTTVGNPGDELTGNKVGTID